MNPVIAFLSILIVARCYFFTRMAKSGVCDITPQYLFLMGIVTGGHFVPLVMNVNPLVVFIALIFGFLHLTLFVVELISFFAKQEDVLPLPPTL